MATLKDQVGSVTALAGTEDFDSALNTISAWRDRAENAPNAEEFENNRRHLADIFSAYGVTEPGAAIEAINSQRGNLSALYSTLGAGDQESAVAAIEALRADNSSAQSRIVELETGQRDFEARVDQEVINRAASAGLTSPIQKPAQTAEGGEGNAKIMSRGDFDQLSPYHRSQYIKGGGRLTD